jgi:hypothetical protein
MVKKKKGTARMGNIHFEELSGRKGRIYVARQGTITVVVLDDGLKLWTNNSVTSTMFSDKLVDGYWIHSIDFAGSYSDYMVNRLVYDTDDKPFYPPAEPLSPLTPERIEKLDRFSQK